MVQILQELFTSSVASYLAFKWGTLAYFCYDLDRYSTDIDLDLLDHDHEQDVIEVVTAILARIGEIKNFTLGRDLHRWIFRYDDRSTNIKVELNKRDLTHNRYHTKIIHDTEITCMDEKTMVTNKLLALHERAYNRDLFDVYFFRKRGYEYDENIVQARTGKAVRDIIGEIIDSIPDDFQQNTILSDGMGDVLTDQQKPRVKQHLANETMHLLQLYLDNDTNHASTD